MSINSFPPQLPLNQNTSILQLVNFCYSRYMMLSFLLLKFSRIYLHYISTTYREHLEFQLSHLLSFLLFNSPLPPIFCLYSLGPHCLTFFEQIHILLFLSLYSYPSYWYLIIKGLPFLVKSNFSSSL